MTETSDNYFNIASSNNLMIESEKSIIPDVISKLDMQPSDRVFDIGCGSGNLLIPLSSVVKEITGVAPEVYFDPPSSHLYITNNAARRDLIEKPMFHSLMWSAILHAKTLGCRWFEMGWQLFLNQAYLPSYLTFADKPPSKKELGISEFKAGFGGETRMFLDLTLDCTGKKNYE